MARPPSPDRNTLVEDCEVICVSAAMGNLAVCGITFEYTRRGRGSQRIRLSTLGRAEYMSKLSLIDGSGHDLSLNSLLRCTGIIPADFSATRNQ
jgi:hypothetical protein